jgi:hypothetical protein
MVEEESQSAEELGEWKQERNSESGKRKSRKTIETNTVRKLDALR